MGNGGYWRRQPRDSHGRWVSRGSARLFRSPYKRSGLKYSGGKSAGSSSTRKYKSFAPRMTQAQTDARKARRRSAIKKGAKVGLQVGAVAAVAYADPRSRGYIKSAPYAAGGVYRIASEEWARTGIGTPAKRSAGGGLGARIDDTFVNTVHQTTGSATGKYGRIYGYESRNKKRSNRRTSHLNKVASSGTISGMSTKNIMNDINRKNKMIQGHSVQAQKSSNYFSKGMSTNSDYMDALRWIARNIDDDY